MMKVSLHYRNLHADDKTENETISMPVTFGEESTDFWKPLFVMQIGRQIKY